MSCDKKAYPSRRVANDAINVFKWVRSKRSYIPKRVYLCKLCGEYHLTSIKIKQRKLIKEKNEPHILSTTLI